MGVPGVLSEKTARKKKWNSEFGMKIIIRPMLGWVGTENYGTSRLMSKFRFGTSRKYAEKHGVESLAPDWDTWPQLLEYPDLLLPGEFGDSYIFNV